MRFFWSRTAKNVEFAEEYETLRDPRDVCGLIDPFLRGPSLTIFRTSGVPRVYWQRDWPI